MGIWAGMVLISGIYGMFANTAEALPAAALSAAGDAVTLILAMAEGYLLWLGLLEIANQAKLTEKISSGLSRLIGPLFPGVRQDGRTMGAICMNLAANLLGMGNAATPFGLAAMESMQNIQQTESASDDMIMLITINCSGLVIFPTTIITMLQAAGSADPFAVTVPCILATAATTVAGTLAAWVLQKGKNG